MRFAFPPLTPVVRALLIVLFASFVVQTITYAVSGVQLFHLLALSPGLSVATAWQWATHVLVEYPSERAVLARAFDLLFLYFWLSPFELEQGRNRTLTLAALGMLGGALLTFAFGLVAPTVAIAHCGAGAIAWAGLASYAVRTRGAPLNLVLLPAMNAWAVAAIFLVMEALECAWARTPTPLLASLGGFAAGVFYTRYLQRPSKPVKKAPTSTRRRGGASHLQVIPGGQADDERPRWLN